MKTIKVGWARMREDVTLYDVIKCAFFYSQIRGVRLRSFLNSMSLDDLVLGFEYEDKDDGNSWVRTVKYKENGFPEHKSIGFDTSKFHEVFEAIEMGEEE